MVQYTVTISGMVVINGSPIHINDRNDLVLIHQHISEYLRLTGDAETQSVLPAKTAEAPSGSQPPVTQRARPTIPLPGKSQRDYLVKVLDRHAEGMYTEEIVQEMKNEGWTTNSKKPTRLLQVMMYHDKATFVRSPSGKWSLTKFKAE